MPTLRGDWPQALLSEKLLLDSALESLYYLFRTGADFKIDISQNGIQAINGVQALLKIVSEKKEEQGGRWPRWIVLGLEDAPTLLEKMKILCSEVGEESTMLKARRMEVNFTECAALAKTLLNWVRDKADVLQNRQESGEAAGNAETSGGL